MDRIKRLSNQVLGDHKSKFGVDFADNKKALDQISIVRSKGLKNEIAGYITKFIKKEIREEKDKQARIEASKSVQLEEQSEIEQGLESIPDEQTGTVKDTTEQDVQTAGDTTEQQPSGVIGDADQGGDASEQPPTTDEQTGIVKDTTEQDVQTAGDTSGQVDQTAGDTTEQQPSGVIGDADQGGDASEQPPTTDEQTG